MIKICKICNKKFKANSNRQTRCVDCMKITCKHCGKEFIPKNHNFTQVYCSRKCKGLNQKHIIINLIKNRGTKPRTYKKRNKHGSIEDREWREKITTLAKCVVRRVEDYRLITLSHIKNILN